MKPRPVSKKLLMRLPLYLNYLKSLPEDTVNVSATTISKALGLGEVQVRKDLLEASPSGRSRIGRSREKLIRDLTNYLYFETATSSIVIGAGKLGQALMDYKGFAEFGVNIVAGFDIVPPIHNHTEAGVPIYAITKLEAFCRKYGSDSARKSGTENLRRAGSLRYPGNLEFYACLSESSVPCAGRKC